MYVCSIPYLLGGDLIGVIVPGQGAFDHRLQSPRVHPQSSTGTAAGSQKADTNQQWQRVRGGDFCYGPAQTGEKALFSHFGYNVLLFDSPRNQSS